MLIQSNYAALLYVISKKNNSNYMQEQRISKLTLTGASLYREKASIFVNQTASISNQDMFATFNTCRGDVSCSDNFHLLRTLGLSNHTHTNVARVMLQCIRKVSKCATQQQLRSSIYLISSSGKRNLPDELFNGLIWPRILRLPQE